MKTTPYTPAPKALSDYLRPWALVKGNVVHAGEVQTMLAWAENKLGTSEGRKKGLAKIAREALATGAEWFINTQPGWGNRIEIDWGNRTDISLVPIKTMKDAKKLGITEYKVPEFMEDFDPSWTVGNQKFTYGQLYAAWRGAFEKLLADDSVVPTYVDIRGQSDNDCCCCVCAADDIRCLFADIGDATEEIDGMDVDFYRNDYWLDQADSSGYGFNVSDGIIEPTHIVKKYLPKGSETKKKTLKKEGDMDFEIIAKDSWSKEDYSAILKFKDSVSAKVAMKEINRNELVKDNVEIAKGQSGAVAIGDCVVFNTESKSSFDELIGLVKGMDYAVTSKELGDLHDAMWKSLADVHQPYSKSRDLAILYFAKGLPGSVVTANECASDDDKFDVEYGGQKFSGALHWREDAESYIRVNLVGDNEFENSFNLYEFNDDPKPFFDGLLGKADAGKPVSKATEPDKTIEDRVAYLEEAWKTFDGEIAKIKKELKALKKGK